MINCGETSPATSRPEHSNIRFLTIFRRALPAIPSDLKSALAAVAVQAGPLLAWVDRRDDPEGVLEGGGVEHEVLAVARADDLDNLRQAVGDADRHGYGGEAERVDRDRHAHVVDRAGDHVAAEVGPDFERDAGADRR